MPNVRPSSYLQNNYNAVSEFCHSSMQPMFITKNGQDDLAVMSVDAYKKAMSRFELYSLLLEGIESQKRGEGRPAEEFWEEFWSEVNGNK